MPTFSSPASSLGTSVESGEITDGAVTTAKIADDAVTADKLANGWVLIATTNLVATATSIDFASIATGFKKFRIECHLKHSTNGSLGLRVNADSAQNYPFQKIEANGSSITSATNTTQTSWLVLTINTNWGNYIFDVDQQDYANTEPSCYGSGGHEGRHHWFQGNWQSSAAEINQLTLIVSSGDIQIGTTATLWGQK